MESRADRRFRRLVTAFASAVILLCAAVALQLASGSRLAWARFGPAFFWSSAWDPVAESFGALPFVFGTLYSSAWALLIAVPLGVGSAVFLAELAPRRVSDACAFLVELLAAVPSVVIGLIGIFVLVPWVRSIEPWLVRHLGWLPFFVGAPYGVGMLCAALILAVMVLPYITSISREVLLSVPQDLKEAHIALGATRWETVWEVSLPYGRAGILGGVFLSLGRALGETMAVTMVIGNTPKVSASLLEPGYSMAAVLANEFSEAVSYMHLNALLAIALVLFLITVAVNGLARLMIRKGSPA